jgi:hypothetical protein
LFDRLQQIVAIHSVLAQQLSTGPIFLIGNREQEMLSREILVLHFLRQLFGRSEYLGQAGTKVVLTALHTREARDCRLAIAEDHLNVRAKLAEQRAHDAFGLFEHRTEQMLRLDLLILVSFSEFDACLNGLLASQCESV